jgi:hypothetical protein
VLFGTLNLSLPEYQDPNEQPMVREENVLGRVNIGWTIGEELLFETEDL